MTIPPDGLRGQPISPMLGARIEEEASFPAYKWTGATILVSTEMLYDSGHLRRPQHTARMWPELVLFPRVEQATSALTRWRDEVSRRLSLAHTALTDPDSLEGDDEW